MDDSEKKAMKAVRALIDIADANFPSDCDIVLHAPGKQTASIKMPSYLLAGILKPAEDT